jgi:hypothetical protein
MHGVLGPAIGKTIALVSAFRQIFPQCGLGRPNLSIAHPRAPDGSGKDVTFRLASADARGYRSAVRDRHWRLSIASCGKQHKGRQRLKENDMQYRNARLRRKIDGALKTRPELEPVVNGIALKQPANASLEQVQANLQERARAIIAAKPELDGYFDL